MGQQTASLSVPFDYRHSSRIRRSLAGSAYWTQPKTGARVDVPAKNIPFKPAKERLKIINR